MITISPSAIEHFKKLLSGKNQSIRVDVKKSGCSGWKYDVQLVDAAADGDLQLEAAINVYASQSAQKLMTGTTIDYVFKNVGSELVFLNPKAKAQCGCGESFSVDDHEQQN